MDDLILACPTRPKTWIALLQLVIGQHLDATTNQRSISFNGEAGLKG
jgi:hypothetical protein